MACNKPCKNKPASSSLKKRGFEGRLPVVHFFSCPHQKGLLVLLNQLNNHHLGLFYLPDQLVRGSMDIRTGLFNKANAFRRQDLRYNQFRSNSKTKQEKGMSEQLGDTQPVAIFDFDGTITRKSTTLPFLRFVFGTALLTKLTCQLHSLILYSLNRIDLDALDQIIVQSFFKHLTRDFLFDKGAQFF